MPTPPMFETSSTTPTPGYRRSSRRRVNHSALSQNLAVGGQLSLQCHLPRGRGKVVANAIEPQQVNQRTPLTQRRCQMVNVGDRRDPVVYPVYEQDRPGHLRRLNRRGRRRQDRGVRALKTRRGGLPTMRVHDRRPGHRQRERAVAANGFQGGVAAGAGSGDEQRPWIDSARGREPLGGCPAVLYVVAAPVAVQRGAEPPSVAGASAVVHLSHGAPSAGEELYLIVESKFVVIGRARMRPHDQRRRVSTATGGWIEKYRRGRAFAGHRQDVRYRNLTGL